MRESDESEDSEDDDEGGAGYTGEDDCEYRGPRGGRDRCEVNACKLCKKEQADDAGEHDTRQSDMADIPCAVAGCAESGAARRRVVADAGATEDRASSGQHDVAGRHQDYTGALAGGAAATTEGGGFETDAEGGGANTPADEDEGRSVASDAEGEMGRGRVARPPAEEDDLSGSPAQLIEVILERQPLSEVTGERENAPLFGVGLGLEPHAGVHVVQVLAPGGAADRSGMFEVGDLVVTVDGVHVSGRPSFCSRVFAGAASYHVLVVSGGEEGL